jgi:hypothetical protein
MDDAELHGTMAVKSSQHANDFNAACLYFSFLTMVQQNLRWLDVG